MLAAQGYQESQLNQSAKSPVGAIGVMQIMPATGAELGVGDIHAIEPNIHGGTKYMDQLMSKYFPTPTSARATGRCSRSPATTAGRAMSPSHARKPPSAASIPDKWFNNVEVVVAEKIGTRTTTYVRNIYKYYVAYRLTLDAQAEAERARRQVSPTRTEGGNGNATGARRTPASQGGLPRSRAWCGYPGAHS
jgi:membrane-bound lytic murein transglycosylase MltF